MNNREIEIDLKSLLIFLFEHWRSIIAGMIICGILGGAFGVYRAQKANSAASASGQSAGLSVPADNGSEKQKKDRSEISPDASLTAKQVSDVEKAVDYMDIYYRMKSYYDSSVFLKLDASALAKGSVIMSVSSSSNENNESIKKVYESYLVSPEMKNYVKEKTGLLFDDARLISVNAQGSNPGNNLNGRYIVIDSQDTNIISFAVIYSDTDSCEKIVDAILGFLSDKNTNVTKAYGAHELKLIDRSVATVADADINDIIVTYTDKMVSYNYRFQDLVTTFTDEQTSYFNALINTLENADRLEIEKFAIPEPDEASAPAVSLKRQGIKYGIVGLFGGAFMMACLWALIYIFRNRTDLYDDIGGYYGVAELGRIPRKKKEKEFIFDKWIRKWKNYPLKSEYDEAVKLCATQIHMMASKEEVDDVIIMSCAKEFEPTGEIEKLANEVSALHIKANTVENVLYDTEKMNRLAQARAVVLAGKSDITRRNDMFKSVDLMKRQGIKVLVGVIIG